MTTQNNLEIKGTLQAHPFAELILETTAAKLTGSFKLSFEAHKVIIYLNDGAVVFAVSNARRHRLFEILLREQKISQSQIVAITNFANDLEFAANLKSQNIVSEAEINQAFSKQIEEILQSVFDWSKGEWIFSPQSRIRENIRFETNIKQLLLNYARNLPEEIVSRRLSDSRETFGANPSGAASTQLLPHEAFVLSRFEKSFLPVSEIKMVSGLPGSETAKILYTLWFGGFLFRQNWQAAFSERKISEILSAKLSLKKENVIPVEKPIEETPVEPVSAGVETISEPPSEKEKPNQLSLDDYLAQVENAANHYQVFNVATDADLKEIKPLYFAFAKQFHPDIFHHEKDAALLQRIQSAFARIAQAYDVLKDADARKIYDYKIDKNLIAPKPKVTETASENLGDRQSEVAHESFELGFNLLMENEYEEAVSHLARAAQLAPKNAKYRAYYGKVLSIDEKQRYKADMELQAAIKLEPQNATYRLISAEFYIQYGLFKRAEGELNRLLSISPNNSEALKLLKSLPEK